MLSIWPKAGSTKYAFTVIAEKDTKPFSRSHDLEWTSSLELQT
jgi:hypothetical protein